MPRIHRLRFESRLGFFEFGIADLLATEDVQQLIAMLGDAIELLMQLEIFRRVFLDLLLPILRLRVGLAHRSGIAGARAVAMLRVAMLAVAALLGEWR